MGDDDDWLAGLSNPARPDAKVRVVVNNHLYYFWTVARAGSISRAAGELRVSQPTISEQIRKLEQTLGTRLFERVGRGLFQNQKRGPHELEELCRGI